jgi:hypothetical protein
MNNDRMTRISISLSKEQVEQLKQLALEGHRPYSQQIVVMMEFFLKYKDKVK